MGYRWWWYGAGEEGQGFEAVNTLRLSGQRALAQVTRPPSRFKRIGQSAINAMKASFTNFHQQIFASIWPLTIVESAEMCLRCA